MKNLFIIFLLYCGNYFCQTVNSSKAYISTCYNKQQCFSLSNGAFIFLNVANSEFIITVDFNKFKIVNDTLDEWLDDLDDTKLIFKGQLNTSNLLELTHHNSKAHHINGIITFNGITKPHTIEFTLFEIANTGILYTNNSQDYFDRVATNLQFAFYPKEFKLDKKKHHLKKSISVAIYKGYINELKPDMLHWVNGKIE